MTGEASFYNCYSVGEVVNSSYVSAGYVCGILGLRNSNWAGNGFNIVNCFCLGEFASYAYVKGNLPTDRYLDESSEFNCTGSNLKGYSNRLGDKFIEDTDGTHNHNPILAWQKIRGE